MDEATLTRFFDPVPRMWERECVILGKSIYAEASPSDNRKWAHPPLVCGLRDTHRGLDFDALLKAIYYAPSHDDEVVGVWDQFIESTQLSSLAVKISAARKLFNQLFPDFSFGGEFQHPYVLATQFLQLAAWQEGRKFSIARNRALLAIDGKPLGFDRLARYDSRGGHRCRMTLADYRAPLRCTRGHTRKPANPKTNATYRLLIRTLPHRAEEIELLFAVAVFLGREYEHMIVSRFDVVVAGEVEANEEIDVFEEARRLIETAAQNPLKKLAALLVPVVGAHEFAKVMGNPHQPVAMTYSEKQQHRHRAGLQVLKENMKPQKSTERGIPSIASALFGV